MDAHRDEVVGAESSGSRGREDRGRSLTDAPWIRRATRLSESRSRTPSSFIPLMNSGDDAVDAEGDQIVGVGLVAERADVADERGVAPWMRNATRSLAVGLYPRALISRTNCGRRAVDAEGDVLVEIFAIAERLHLADEADGDIVEGQREEAVVIEIARGDAEAAKRGGVGRVRLEGEAADAVAVLRTCR